MHAGRDAGHAYNYEYSYACIHRFVNKETAGVQKQNKVNNLKRIFVKVLKKKNRNVIN